MTETSNIDLVDTNLNWKLRIIQSFLISSIDSVDQITLGGSITPDAGTYNFYIGDYRYTSPRDAVEANLRAERVGNHKIEGLEIDASYGTIDQGPLPSHGGVGGSVSAETSKSDDLKVIGTSQGNSLGISPIAELGDPGTTMESGLPDGQTGRCCHCSNRICRYCFWNYRLSKR